MRLKWSLRVCTGQAGRREARIDTLGRGQGGPPPGESPGQGLQGTSWGYRKDVESQDLPGITTQWVTITESGSWLKTDSKASVKLPEMCLTPTTTHTKVPKGQRKADGWASGFCTGKARWAAMAVESYFESECILTPVSPPPPQS